MAVAAADTERERDGIAEVSIASLLERAANGATVKVRAGRYRESIVISRPVTLVAADGPGSVVIELERPAAIRADTELRGLVFHGAGIDATGTTRLSLTDCSVRGSGSTALSLRESARLHATRVTISEAGGSGLRLGGSAEAFVTGSILENTAYSAVELSGLARLRLEDCTVRDSREHGVHAKDESGLQINGGSVGNCEMTGILAETSGPVAIEACDVEATGQAGILAGDGAGLEIQGGRITGCGGSGLVVWTGATARARGLVIAGARRNGLYLADGAHGLFEDCEISDTEYPAVYVGEEADPTLRRLRVDDAQQDMEIAESARPIVEPAGVGEPAPDDEISAPRYADEHDGHDGYDEQDEQEKKEDFDTLARTFGDLVGLGSVKLEMSTIVNVIRLGRRRIAIGLPPPPFARHLLFAGGPGTGKTTVARLYARILHALDVTEHGRLVVAGSMSPGDGPTGRATAKIAAAFDRARGGVLYIEQAHTLASPGGESRGESVSALIEWMSDQRDETVVILAGEPDGLRRLVDANPELAEDFTRTVVFDGYTPDELTVILERQTLELRYGLGPGTREAVTHSLRHGQRDAGPGSTLAARRLLQTMIERHAQRVAGLVDPDARDLIELKPEDVPTLPDAATPPPGRLPPSDRLARPAPPARTQEPAKPTRAAVPSRPVNHNFD